MGRCLPFPNIQRCLSPVSFVTSLPPTRLADPWRLTVIFSILSPCSSYKASPAPSLQRASPGKGLSLCPVTVNDSSVPSCSGSFLHWLSLLMIPRCLRATTGGAAGSPSRSSGSCMFRKKCPMPVSAVTPTPALPLQAGKWHLGCHLPGSLALSN